MSDVSKANELIAEIRETHERQDRREGEPPMCLACSPADWPCDAVRAADALEAATRAPVQGEPSHDRETILAIMNEVGLPHDPYFEDIADAILVAGFSRAAVPDAATERISKLEFQRDIDGEKIRQAEAELRDVWRVDVPSLKAERDAALAAVERCRAIHHPDPYDVSGKYCTCEEAWPCSTVEALDRAPEPEWEREYRRVRPDGVPVFNAVFESLPVLDDYYTAEYRTVSPWLPVEGESI